MPATTLDDITDAFALFGGWEERYRYLIDLGQRLSPMNETLKTDATLVRGCTSRVWLVPEIKDDILHFQADSDAQIVRGLVYLLMLAYQDKPLAAVRAYDIHAAFSKLGLEGHLSPNRRNGFFAMVERIKAAAT